MIIEIVINIFIVYMTQMFVNSILFITPLKRPLFSSKYYVLFTTFITTTFYVTAVTIRDSFDVGI